jgi:hypothetical protein
MFLDHTQRRITVGRTPLDERSARRRDLYLTTYDTHNRQISMPLVGFEPKTSAEILGSIPTGGMDICVMTMEILASVHVFITSKLRIFVNRLVTYRVSKCLTNCHNSKVVLHRHTANVILVILQRIRVSALSPL